MGSPSEHARQVLGVTMARPATLGAGRLVCVDGPAGSGKTTLTSAIAELAPHATVLHSDEMIAGWSGLPRLAHAVRALLEPLAAGLAGSWRRWDWHTSAWAETRSVEPVDLVVVEGVGSWSPYVAPWVTTLVWVDAPHDVRMRRGIERDGEDFAPYWEQWARDEAAVFARDRTREHADVVIAT
ncbi:Uridine kinase [Nocardioides terrae]|uniref:Uridine kinase n=1 Tax=Nocardioides terrae TaxID=574651 RepID=A0A1I1M240_9ACTN|nr:4-amino-4-deoxy-L-arabinose transferase [Nocardioides terrae]SFC79441.1 Uridine kinase [Nocardioides terrae]